MAFQGIGWTDGTKSLREDPAKADQIRREINESRNQSGKITSKDVSASKTQPAKTTSKGGS